MKKLTRFALTAMVGLGPFPAAEFAFAQSAPPRLAPAPSGMVLVFPQSAGMSGERVDRISKTMQRYVAEGRVAGTMTVLIRRGKLVQFEATGMADIERNVPMKTDTIFRIASMSKAVTSVAAMILIEEGLLSLETPVSRFFPFV